MAQPARAARPAGMAVGVDLDGDGDLDLWEWSHSPKQTIRWHENRDGKLMSAQTLYEQGVAGAPRLPVVGGPAELLLLGGVQEGLLALRAGLRRRSELGRQESLPMPGGPKALWYRHSIGGSPGAGGRGFRPAAARVQPIGDAGWQAERHFR